MVQTFHREKSPPRVYEVVRAIWWQGNSLRPGELLTIDDPTVASDLCHIGRIRLAAAQPGDAAPPSADAPQPAAGEAAPGRERAPRKPRAGASA